MRSSIARRTPRRAAGWLIGLSALALLGPSANHQVFDGLPLSHPLEYVVAVLLALVAAQRGLRGLAARELRRRAWLWRGLLVATGAALVLKALLFSSGDHRGWRACYASPLATPAQGRCEKSFENPWHRFGVTRVDAQIDFARVGWNLTFLNDIRFNIPQWIAENRRRDRLPFTATWTGHVHAPTASVLAIDYVGHGAITAGFETTTLAPAYETAGQAAVRLPAGVHEVRVAYVFDDGTRVRDRITGPFARVRVRFLDDRGTPLQVPVAPAGHTGWLRAAGVLADACIALVALAVLLLVAGVLAPDWWRVLIVAGAFVATPGAFETAVPPVPSLKALVASGLVLLGVLLRRRRRARDVTASALVLVAVGFFVFVPIYGDVGTVVLRSAGDDWLTYESLARAILDTGSLEGGERVFYYQPLFRYIRFTERLLLGDGDLLVVVTAFAALQLSIVASLRAFSRRQSPRTLIVCVLAGMLMTVVVCARTGAMRFLVLGASEYPTWILLPAAVAHLFACRSPRAAIGGAAMLGASALTRLNQLPALLAIHAAFLARHRHRTRVVLGAAAVLAGLLVLPVVHNVRYGGEWQLLTDSRGIPENYVLAPRTILAAVWDPVSRGAVVSQFRFLAGLEPIPHDWLVRPALHGLQLLWLGVAAWAAASGRLTLWSAIVAVTPVLYLGTHLVYQVDVYYPRHILAGHLMMGVAAAVVAAADRSSPPTPRGSARGG